MLDVSDTNAGSTTPSEPCWVLALCPKVSRFRVLYWTGGDWVFQDFDEAKTVPNEDVAAWWALPPIRDVATDEAPSELLVAAVNLSQGTPTSTPPTYPGNFLVSYAGGAFGIRWWDGSGWYSNPDETPPNPRPDMTFWWPLTLS